MDRFTAFAFTWGGAVLGLFIGAIYFLKSAGRGSVGSRLATSAYGPALAVLFTAVALLWPETYRFNSKGERAFLWLQGIPLFLLVLSLIRYPGPRKLHWYLVPLGVVAWAWTLAFGWVGVHGK